MKNGYQPGAPATGPPVAGAPGWLMIVKKGIWMYPHRIRLRGPWECEPLARAAGDQRPLPRPCRMTMPRRWKDGGLADFRGRVRFRRRFGYPGRIDSYERVWLTVGQASDRVRIALNGAVLGESEGGGWETDVTALLGERNELTVEVGGGEDGGLWGEVALEVRCTAFLRNVSCGALPAECGLTQVFAGGELVGSAADLLELYLLLDGSTLAYAALAGPVAGQTFRLVSEPLPPERLAHDSPHWVQIDLVRAATVWYRWEQELTLGRPSGSHEGDEWKSTS